MLHNILALLKTLCDQLTVMGHPVDDTDKAHWYLRGLGIDFANFSLLK